MMTLRCVAPAGDVCGEAATWSADEDRLYWTDINRFLLHRMDRRTEAVTTHFFDEPVTALSLTDAEGVLLVALGSKLVLLTVETDRREDLGVRLPDAPQARFNDGRTDPAGTFWIGSMGNNVGLDGEGLDVVDGLGRLFRLRGRGPLETVEEGIGIANTVCWAPDGRTFYFADTLRNRVQAYPFDPATGTLGTPRSHFEGFARGAPDGSAMDAEGYLWNCRWGGACVVRVAPDGSVDRVVEMPVRNVTTACFGGPGLSTLYITTAAADRAPGDRLAGSVFALETGTRGLPENRFRIGGVA